MAARSAIILSVHANALFRFHFFGVVRIELGKGNRANTQLKCRRRFALKTEEAREPRQNCLDQAHQEECRAAFRFLNGKGKRNTIKLQYSGFALLQLAQMTASRVADTTNANSHSTAEKTCR